MKRLMQEAQVLIVVQGRKRKQGLDGGEKETKNESEYQCEDSVQY